MNTAFNLTPRAKRLLALARAEAGRFSQDAVGAEHLLLAMITLGEGVAVQVLENLGLDLQIVRLEVERQIQSKGSQAVVGGIPHSPCSKKALALAEEERKQFNHTYLGTEHVLLGILRAGETVPFRVLAGLGVEVEKTRSEVRRVLSSPDSV